MAKPKQPGQMVHLNAVRHDEREVRRAEAWGLRREGLTVREIAARLDISVGAVALYLQETLAELKAASRESADSWRQLHLDRLDAVISTWLPVSRDPSHPEAARGAAIVVRAVEAQAKLLGLLTTNAVLPGHGQFAKETEKPFDVVTELANSEVQLVAFERAIAAARKKRAEPGFMPADGRK